MPTTTEPNRRSHRPRVNRAIVALACAALLLAAPAIPIPERLIVLPALLFGPGWALIQTLDVTVRMSRSWSLIVSMSLVVTVLATVVLNWLGSKLDTTSLGITLGVFTAALTLVGLRHREQASRKAQSRAQFGPSLDRTSDDPLSDTDRS